MIVSPKPVLTCLTWVAPEDLDKAIGILGLYYQIYYALKSVTMSPYIRTGVSYDFDQMILLGLQVHRCDRDFHHLRCEC